MEHMTSQSHRIIATIASMGGVLICLLVLLPGVAKASFCYPDGDSLQNAPIVFSGLAASIKLEIHDPSGVPVNNIVPYASVDQIVNFQVRKVWKGDVGTSVVVQTGSHASRDCGVGNCGYKFEAGKSYLVFAYQGEWGSAPSDHTFPVTPSASIVTDKCTRTKLLSQASADLAALGQARLPTTGSGQFDTREVLMLAAMTAVLIGSMLRRRG